MSAFDAGASAVLPSLRSTRAGRILQAVSSSAAARLLGAAATLVTLPMAVRYLGAERYGVWATITTTTVWVNLLDLGIANTLTNHISRAYALDDKPAAAKSLTTALAITGSVAVLLGAAFLAMSAHINWIKIFNTGQTVTDREVAQTVSAAFVLVLLSLVGNLGGKVLAGYQELHLNSLAVAIGALASVAGLAAGIWLHVSMPVLFVMTVGGATFSSVLSLFLVSCWYKPWLRPKGSLIEVAVAKDLLSSGSSFFLIGLSGVVVFSSDNLVVSHYCGAAEVTPYSVTWRFIGLAAVLQSLLFPALWPAYAEANARRDLAWIRRTFRTVMKGTLGFNMMAVLGMMFFGRILIRSWAGSAAVPSTALLLTMGLWSIINGFMNVESCLLAALNRTREQAILSALAAVVNLVLSIWLVQRIGAVGVIAGTVLSYLLVLVVPQSLLVRKVLQETTQPCDILIHHGEHGGHG